jgi:hypothetical protein
MRAAKLNRELIILRKDIESKSIIYSQAYDFVIKVAALTKRNENFRKATPIS